MTKQEFKQRWESAENGDGIIWDDIAACYVAWGVGTAPRIRPLSTVRYQVLKAAGTVDAEEYNPEELT